MLRKLGVSALLIAVLVGVPLALPVSPQEQPPAEEVLGLLAEVNVDLKEARDRIETELMPALARLLPHLSWPVSFDLPPPNELRSISQELPSELREPLEALGVQPRDVPESQRRDDNRRFELLRQEPSEPRLGIGLNPWSGRLEGALCSTDIVIVFKVCSATPPGIYRKLYDVFRGSGSARERVAQLWLEITLIGEGGERPEEPEEPEEPSGSGQLTLTVRSVTTEGRFFEGAPIEYVIEGDPARRGETTLRIRVPKGKRVQLKALDTNGLRFQRWQGAPAGANPVQMTVNADATAVAVYERLIPTEDKVTLTIKSARTDTIPYEIGGVTGFGIQMFTGDISCNRPATPIICQVTKGAQLRVTAPESASVCLNPPFCTQNVAFPFFAWKGGPPSLPPSAQTGLTTPTLKMDSDKTWTAWFRPPTPGESPPPPGSTPLLPLLLLAAAPSSTSQEPLLMAQETVQGIHDLLGRALNGLDRVMGSEFEVPGAAREPLSAAREATVQAVSDLEEIGRLLGGELEGHGGESVSLAVKERLTELAARAGTSVAIAIQEKERGETVLRQSLVPDIEVTPTHIDFGNVRVGKSKSETLEIANKGQVDLIIFSISLQSRLAGRETPFDLNLGEGANVPFTLKPGERRTVQVLFAPKREGFSLDSVNIDSNDPDEGSIEIRLEGRGEVRSCDEVRSEWEAQNELFQAQKRRCEELRRQVEASQARVDQLEEQLQNLRDNLQSLKDKDTGFEEARRKMEELLRFVTQRYGGYSLQPIYRNSGEFGCGVKLYIQGDPFGRLPIGLLEFIRDNRELWQERRRACRRAEEAERAKAKSIEELEQAIGSLEEALVGAREDLEAAKRALEDCQSQLERLRESLERLEQERQDCLATENKLRGVEEKLIGAESAMALASGVIGRADKFIEFAESELGKLKDPCKECEEALEEARKLRNQANERLANARAQIETARRSLEEARQALRQGDLQGARDRLSEAGSQVEEAADQAEQSIDLGAESQSRSINAFREAERRARQERREEERRASAREDDRRVLDAAKDLARSQAVDPEVKKKIEELIKDGELSDEDIKKITEIISNAPEPGKAAAAVAQALEGIIEILGTSSTAMDLIKATGELIKELQSVRQATTAGAVLRGLAGFIVTLPYSIVQNMMINKIFDQIDKLIELLSSPCDDFPAFFWAWWDGLQDFEKMIILRWFGLNNFVNRIHRLNDNNRELITELICARLRAFEIVAVAVGETKSFDFGTDEERLNTITIRNTGKTPITMVKICFERGVNEDGEELGSLDVGEETKAPEGWKIVEIDENCITLQAESTDTAIQPGALEAFTINSEDDARATQVSVTMGKLGIMGDKKFWSVE